MTKPLAPVRPISLAEMREARTRIAKTIVRTPLLRLDLGPGFPDIRLKLENLQPINAYKLRGAANAVAMLSKPKSAPSSAVTWPKRLTSPRACITRGCWDAMRGSLFNATSDATAGPSRPRESPARR